MSEEALLKSTSDIKTGCVESSENLNCSPNEEGTSIDSSLQRESDPVFLPNDNSTQINQSVENTGAQLKTENLNNENTDDDIDHRTLKINATSNLEPIYQIDSELEGVHTDANENFQKSADAIATQRDIYFIETEAKQEENEVLNVADERNGEPDLTFETQQQVTLDEKTEPVKETSEEQNSVERVFDNSKLFREIVDGEQGDKDVLDRNLETHTDSLTQSGNHNPVNIETDITINDTKEALNINEADVQQSVDEPKYNTEPISKTTNHVYESSIKTNSSGNEIVNSLENTTGLDDSTRSEDNGILACNVDSLNESTEVLICDSERETSRLEDATKNYVAESVFESNPSSEIGIDQEIPESLTQDECSNNTTDTTGPTQSDSVQTTAIKNDIETQTVDESQLGIVNNQAESLTNTTSVDDSVQTPVPSEVALIVETIPDTSQVSDSCVAMDTSIIGNNIDESSYVEIHQQETHISTETETCTTSNISSYPTDSEGKNFTNIPKVEGANEKDSSTNQPENGEGFDETLTKVIIDKDGIPRVSQTDLTENQAVEASPLSHEGNDDTVQTSVTTEVILTDEAYTENSQKAEDNCVPRETSVIENSLDESSLIATQQQETRVSADTDVLPTSYISGSPTVEGINEEDSEINLTDNGEGIDETLTKVIIDEEGYPHVSQTDLKGDQVVKDLPVSQEGDEEADTGTDIAVEELTHLKVSAAESSMDVDHMASSEVSISIDNNTVEMSDGTNEINYQDDFEEEPNIMETPDQTNENDMPSTIPIENEPDYAVAAREELNEASNTLEYSNINHKNLTSDNAEATAESTYSEGSEKGDRSEAINEGEQLLPVKQELSPLEQLLQRNVTIDGDMSSIPDYEAKLTNLMKSMDDVLKHNLEILKMQSLKDFTADLGKFRGDMQTINDAFIKCSTMSENITYVLKELRQATEEVKSQILRKFHQEDLSSWIDNAVENDKAREMLQETIQAEERRCLAKAAEARHAAAVASTGVAQAQQLVAELEALAADADAQAKSAAAMAAAAVVAAEEARVAAVEKRRAEEEATRRAEEKARIKAEEEEKRKAEEEMKIAQEAARKGTDIEGERKTFMEEKAIKEAERKNPKNWPCYTYDGNGTDFKPSVACIIRAIEGSLRKTDVTCKCVDQSTGVLALGESEELVSNIIEIQQTDENLQLHFEESMSIAFPISLSRLPTGKETVIRKQGHDGVWRVLPASDTHFEDYKELKFVDCRSATFGVFAVIMRPKRDQLTFTRRGNKPTCSFDSRLFFLNRRGTVKHNVNVELEVNPLDMNLVPDLRARAPRECEDLLTASSIITLRAPPDFVLQKPLTVTVPLPQIQKRPTTSLAKEMRTADLRPLTARPSEPTEGDETESVHVLCRDIKGGWTILRDVNIISHTNKDVVNFDLMEFRERYILLRTKPDKRDAAVEKMATLVEQASLRRNVKIILRQRNTNILDVKVACAISNAAERTMKSLGEEGYTEGPTPSGDVSLREGQELFMRFRGNLECATKSPRLSLIFNSNIRAVTRFLVTEKDAYAQKGLNCYRGFVQVFTKALVPRPLVEGAAKNAVPEMVEAEILLTELLVELPKPEVTPPQPLATAPIFIKEGPMTNGVLRMLAGQLGNEWRELAAALSVPRMRIQAILRQHVNLDTADTRYDMLVTWAKRVPRSIDKVQVLSEALEGCGRKDLAEEVRQKGQRYKQQRFICARVSHLKQAFVKVAKANEVFGNWKVFAKKLGVRVDDIERIEDRGGSGQEMCYSSLEAWQTTAGEDATITTLANHLRSDHQEKLSRDVESIGLMGALMS